MVRGNLNLMRTVPLLLLVVSTLPGWGGCSFENKNAPVSVQENSATPRFTVIRVDPRTERLELFSRDEDGQPFARFDRLKAWLEGKNKRLKFAMNAGMFKPDLSPVGLFVQDGQEVS